MPGFKRKEVARDWRKLRNQELYVPYFLVKYWSADQIKEEEMGWHVARVGGKKNACRILVRKLEGKRLL
jgi:hypothetical protein